MRLAGSSFRAIARALTDDGIPNPTAYYTRLDGRKSVRRNLGYWTTRTVSEILSNPTYTGRMTQHLTTRFSYKNHKVLHVPESEHVVKENAHEAIVDRDTWEKVQAMRTSVSRGRADKENRVHPLSGLLFCADCGCKLKFKSGGQRRGVCNYYLCRRYIDVGKKYCTSHAISDRQIEGIVLSDIRAMLCEVELDEAAAKERFLRERAKRGERNKLSDEKALRSLQDRLAELNKLIQSAFEEKVLGALPESVLKSLCEKYQAEKETTERKLAEIEARLAEADSVDAEVEEYIARLKRYARCEELTREMCLQLIEFITVGEKTEADKPREIHIYYKFISNAPADFRGQTNKQIP